MTEREVRLYRAIERDGRVTVESALYLYRGGKILYLNENRTGFASQVQLTRLHNSMLSVSPKRAAELYVDSIRAVIRKHERRINRLVDQATAYNKKLGGYAADDLESLRIPDRHKETFVKREILNRVERILVTGGKEGLVEATADLVCQNPLPTNRNNLVEDLGRLHEKSLTRIFAALSSPGGSEPE